MKIFDRLFSRFPGRGRTRAAGEPAATEQSARDRTVAREYWDAQVAADLKRRGVASNRRPN